MDIIHLVITGGAAFLFTGLFLLVPLLFSKSGREPWSGKVSVLSYFACLEAGFILFELIYIQILMKLIGYPVYTYSTVVFSFLFGAALGSISSEKLGLIESMRWKWAFIGIFISVLAFYFFNHAIFNLFLQTATIVRILVAVLMILPLAFFLGMPFPLGILTIRHKVTGTVAWAWAINSLFTVISGLASVVLSVFFGFRVTLLVGIAIYFLAFCFFHGLYKSRENELLAVKGQ